MSGIQFQNKTQLKHAKNLYWHLRDDYISDVSDFDKKAVKYFKGKLSGTYHGRKWRVPDGSRIIIGAIPRFWVIRTAASGVPKFQ